MTSTNAPRTRRAPRAVSKPHDPAERQADRAADTVARGGSVGGWSFGTVPLSAGVHRDGPASTPQEDDDKRLAEIEQASKDANATDGEKAVKGATKVAEGIAKTPLGKQAIQLVRDRPDVASVERFLGTTAGKIAIGGVAAVGLTGLAVAKQPMPFSVPAIPVSPTLSLKPEISGPLNAPTGVMITLSYKGTSRSSAKDPNSKEAVAADIARIKKDSAWLTDAVQRAREAEGQGGGAGGTVQREAATATEPAPPLATARVDDAVASGGRPLDPALRHSMEARFRADFSGVRLHAGGRASDAAADLDATAFTVGEDIGFAGSIPDASTYEGRHLLAHELAHVVQQRSVPRRGGFAPLVHRRSVGEWLGIFFGTTEGNWTDQELRSYLNDITAKGKYDGAFDADNKARAIVRKWKAATPGWDISGRQKGLLIDEMIDGPTLNEDENAILDLLEGSEPGDLRVIFRDAEKRAKELDEDFHYEEHTRLLTFLTARFKGGLAALRKGDVEVIGAAVPPAAPPFAFDAARLEARLDGEDTAQEILDVISRFSSDDRRKATDHLLHISLVHTMDERGRVQMSEVSATGDRKTQLAERLALLDWKLYKLKVILPRLLLEDVPKTSAEAEAQTKPLTAEQAKAAREAFSPKQYDPLVDDVIDLDEPSKKAVPSPAETTSSAAAAKSPPAKKTAAQVKAEAARKKAEAKKAKEEEKRKHGPESEYRKEVQTLVSQIIEDRYQAKVVKQGTHADTALIEPMAGPAKDATDAVFGNFRKRPAMTTIEPATLHSWHKKFSAEVGRMSRAQRVELAFDWIMYYFQIDIRALNDQYDANPKFTKRGAPDNVAAKTLTIIARELVKGGVTKDGMAAPKTVADKLLATKRNWGGMARDEVFVDLYLPDDATEARLARWHMLHTLIHEYIHLLVAQPYEKYAETFGEDSVEWNTLIEGVDDVFTAMVWANLAPKATSKDLRKAVEGEEDAAKPPIALPIPYTYPSYVEAIRLTEVVGLKNLMAAYFLGLMDRLGVPKPGGKR